MKCSDSNEGVAFIGGLRASAAKKTGAPLPALPPLNM